MTSDSLLRYLNEGTHRQRVFTQQVARWAQARCHRMPMIISPHTTAINGSILLSIPPASLSFQVATLASRRRRGLAAINLLASGAALALVGIGCWVGA